MINKNNKVNPIKLKGKDKLNHIIGLMSKLDTVNESVKPIPSISISKKGPDGHVYAIIRENSDYFIKIAKEKNNLSVNDFKYIGGLANKRDFAFETYNKAIRVLNNKLTSLFESYDIKTNIDTFKTDGLVKEEAAFGHGFVQEDEELLCDDGVNECDDIKETEDMGDLTLPKEDKENSGDNLDGDFKETPKITNESVKTTISILDAINGDGNVIPEGYMDLMYKKVNESEDLDKGKFTTWCKENGFDGPCIECAKKAHSSSESAKKMATFYMNTVKPGGHDASYLSESLKKKI